MKLTAAILFAVSNAQREGGRQREKETPSTSDDAFAAYFGDTYDYGAAFDGADFGSDAFGDSADAFDNLSFGDYNLDYDGTSVDEAAIEASVQADASAANRPTSSNDDNDGKTLIPGDITNGNDRTNSGFNAYCWENSASSKADWAATSGATAGSWHQCLGEGSACEVKVVRKLSDDSIVQITSKCANEVSCVANMKQNFNPYEDDVGSTKVGWYVHYLNQPCKPFGVGDRFKSNNERSTCFFCVEPCSQTEQSTGVATGSCVGPADNSGTAKGTVGFNAQDGNPLDIFEPTDLASDGGTNTFKSDNYYSVVSGTVGGIAMEVSKIQAAQLGSTTFIVG